MIPQAILTNFAAACSSPGFFALPTWYKYLEKVESADGCQPTLKSIWDFWLVAAAVIEMLIRIAAFAAIVFVVWGGIKYIMSKGDPNNTKVAQQTIINALVGLVISVAATAIITFVAGRFS